MSTTIDEKVVEMRFDNAQFERGASQSISTIDKLKESLSFKDTSNYTTTAFNEISQGVEKLVSRFSFLGEKLMEVKNYAFNLTKSLTLDQVTAGWDKYAEITKATQTIMSATRTDIGTKWADQGEQMAYINDQLEKLNWFTDETSYNLTDMTSNIGKFTAAGIDLEDATNSMMGIATWAGLSGANVEQASRAMYNLSQAMGQGALRVQDWMSIENANMATKEFKETLIQAGLEAGTLKKAGNNIITVSKGTIVTAENLRSTLADVWVNSKVLTSALKKYGDFATGLYDYTEQTGLTATQMLKYIGQVKDGSLDLANSVQMSNLASSLQVPVEDLTAALTDLSSEYNDLGFAAFRASQEAKTFQEAIDYTKDAASTGWMNTFRTIFGDYLESKELWTSVAEEMYDVFLEDLDNQNRVLKQWGEMGGREKILEAAENLWGRIKGIMMSVKDAFRDVFPPVTASRLMDITDAFKSLEYILSLTQWKTGKLTEIFTNLFKGFKYIGDSIKNILSSVVPALDSLDLLPKDAFKEGGVIDWIEKVVEKFKSITYVFSVTKSQGKKFTVVFMNLFSAIESIIKSVVKTAQALGEAFIKIFPPSSKGILTDIIEIFSLFINKLEITDERAAKLERVFEGLFSILDIARMFIEAILDVILDLSEESYSMSDGVLDVAASIGDWVVSVRNWLKENEIFKKGAQAVADFIRKIPVWANNASEALFGMSLDELWQKIKEGAIAAWNAIKNFFINLPSYAESASQALFGMGLADVWEKIKESVSTAWESIKEFFAIFRKEKDGMDDGTESGNKFADSMDRLKENIEKAKEVFEEIKPYIEDFGKMIKDNVNLEFDLGDWGTNKGDALKNFGVFGLLIAATGVMTEFFMTIRQFRKNSGNIAKSIKTMFDTISKSIKSLTGTIKNNIKAKTFKTIATAILEIAAAIFILCLLPQDKMIVAASAIAFLMGELALSFALISRTGTSEKKLKQIKGMLGMMEIILATLAGAIYLLATQTDIDNAIAAGTLIGALLAEIGYFFTQFKKVNITEKKAEQMTKLIAAICGLIFVIGISIAAATSGLNASNGSIESAGVVIGAILAEIGLFMMNLDKTKLTEKRVANIAAFLKAIIPAIVAIGAAVMLMTFGGADWKSIASAGAALSVVLLAIAAAMNIMPDSSKISDNAKSLTIIALALIMIGAAIAIVALVPSESLLPGILALSLMLTALGVALKVLGEGSGDMIKGAAALLIASVSLIAIAVALNMVVQVAQSGYGIQAITMLAASILILVAAAYVCQNPAIQTALLAIGGAIALIGIGALAAGAGLLMFAQAVERLVAAGPEGVTLVIQAIKEFFTILPDIVTNIVISIGNFIDAFVSMRDKFLNGLVTFLMVILEAIEAVVPKLIQVITEIAIQLLDSARQLIPHIMEFLKELFFAINDFIWVTAPEVVSTVIMLVRELLRSLLELTPDITSAFFTLLIDTLTQLKDNIGEIVALLTEIAIETILGTIDGITAEIPHFLDSLWNFWITLIDSFATSLDEHAEELHDAIIHLCESVIETVKEFFGIHSPSTVFSDFGTNLVQGLINGIESMFSDIGEAITDLAFKITTSICNALGIDAPDDKAEMFQMAKKAIEQFISGINNMIESAKEKIRELADKVLTAICEFFGVDKPESQNEMMTLGVKIIQKFNAGIYSMVEKAKKMITDLADKCLTAICNFFGVDKPSNATEMYKIGKQVIQGMIDGIIKMGADLTSKATGVVNDAVNAIKELLGIASPSKLFMQFGEYMDEGMAMGLDKYSHYVGDSSSNLGEVAISNLSSAISSISDLVNDEMDVDPVIKPVLDLSNVTAGANAIDGMLSSDRSMSLAAYSDGDINSRIYAKNNTPSALDSLRMALSGYSNGGVVNNNTFNISGDDPRAIAEEVNNILQNQINRKDAVWA